MCTITGAGFSQQAVESSDTGSGDTLSALDFLLGGIDVPYAEPVASDDLALPPPRAWDANDLSAGFTVEAAHRWQLGLAYTILTSPDGSFPAREDAGVCVSYDDSRFWAGSFPNFKGLQPCATVAFDRPDQVDGRSDKGIYLQVGINPGYEFTIAGDHPVVASLPVTLGLGADYDELALGSSQMFGYLNIGFALSTPLSLIPKRFGSWGVTTSVDFLFLGDGQEARNGGDDFEVIGSITFGFEF
ncbi:MAG: hypothetical protein ACYTGW_04000 [Planctomycetota bacterium]|jgi:hypothetical protein